MWTATLLKKIYNLKVVYFAYFLSTTIHRTIVLENSTDGKEIGYSQNKIIQITRGAKRKKKNLLYRNASILHVPWKIDGFMDQ